MSGPRPSAAPGLFAALSAGAPARVVKKLDAAPKIAEGWSWAEGGGAFTVTTEGGEVVTLSAKDGAVHSLADVKCSCLLSPRCLHLLAVISSLPIAEESSSTVTAAAPRPVIAGTSASALSPERRRAATEAWRAGAELLLGGAGNAGAVIQGELLRAVHSCRAAHLPRLASAGLRLVRAIKDLRSGEPEFQLGGLTADLAELLACAGVLSRAPEASTDDELAAVIGVARRSYEEIGHLRLFGLFTEPVISGNGYAGVVTFLADAKGGIYSVGDVLPGDPSRVANAYGTAARVGGGSLVHQELCREGLFIQGATASPDGRLGAGSGVQSVRAGPTEWSDPAIAALFGVPLKDQLGRAFLAQQVAPAERGAGAELLFLTGRLLGADGEAVVVAADAGEASPVSVRLIAPNDHPELAYLDNLKLLARAPGLSLRVVGKLVPSRPRTLTLLAFGPPAAIPGAEPAEGVLAPPRLILPEKWRGRCNAGLDRLQRGNLSAAAPSAVASPIPVLTERPDPLVALRRRVMRLALGGRSTLPPETAAAVAREAKALDGLMMPSAARVLETLLLAAHGEGPRKANPEALAAAFASAASYQRAASIALQRSAWE